MNGSLELFARAQISNHCWQISERCDLPRHVHGCWKDVQNQYFNFDLSKYDNSTEFPDTCASKFICNTEKMFIMMEYAVYFPYLQNNTLVKHKSPCLFTSRSRGQRSCQHRNKSRGHCSRLSPAIRCHHHNNQDSRIKKISFILTYVPVHPSNSKLITMQKQNDIKLLKMFAMRHGQKFNSPSSSEKKTSSLTLAP